MILDIEHSLFYYEHLFDNPNNIDQIKNDEESFVHAHVKPKYDADCIFMYQIV